MMKLFLFFYHYINQPTTTLAKEKTNFTLVINYSINAMLWHKLGTVFWSRLVPQL
jgi:hypothetical protein